MFLNMFLERVANTIQDNMPIECYVVTRPTRLAQWLRDQLSALRCCAAGSIPERNKNLNGLQIVVPCLGSVTYFRFLDWVYAYKNNVSKLFWKNPRTKKKGMFYLKRSR